MLDPKNQRGWDGMGSSRAPTRLRTPGGSHSKDRLGRACRYVAVTVSRVFTTYEPPRTGAVQLSSDVMLCVTLMGGAGLRRLRWSLGLDWESSQGAVL